MAEWTLQLTLDLIGAVKEKNILWNIYSDSYKDRKKREQAWKAVATTINVSKQEANDKWRLLRQQFRVSILKGFLIARFIQKPQRATINVLYVYNLMQKYIHTYIHRMHLQK